MNRNAERVLVARPKLRAKKVFQNIWGFEFRFSMQFVNVHSHKPSVNHSSEIINLVIERDSLEDLSSDRLYSIGIHPWYTENLDKSKKKLTQYSILPNIVAIGECGFDSKSTLSFADQELLFVYHAELSEKLGKPLIIHSVNTINEVIRKKKELKPQLPWIIHGFNANIQAANECIKHGLYLSIGHQLCNRNSSVAKIIEQLPLSGLFFETDESDRSIEEIYKEYAQITRKPLKDVGESIYANFARNFLKNHGNN